MKTNDKNSPQKTETHPLLPSGEWEGFYCYRQNSAQHKMFIELLFSNSRVSGSGSDDVAPFIWKGTYDLETFKIQMNKHYSTHTVFYKGDIDENGIWGIWEIAYDYSKIPSELVDSIKGALKQHITGGFHIWPKKAANETNSIALEAQTESKKLKKIFVEVLN